MSSFNPTQSTASYYSTIFVKAILMVALSVAVAFGVIAAGNISEAFQTVVQIAGIAGLTIAFYFIAAAE